MNKFKMINPNTVKRDLNPVKFGLDSKRNLQISLSHDAVKRLGLLDDEDTPIVQLGVDGTLIGIFAAAIGEHGFELKKTVTRTINDSPRYTLAVQCDALFEGVEAESFRARTMTSVQFMDDTEQKGLTFDTTDHLFPFTDNKQPEPEPEQLEEKTPEVEVEQEKPAQLSESWQEEEPSVF